MARWSLGEAEAEEAVEADMEAEEEAGAGPGYEVKIISQFRRRHFRSLLQQSPGHAVRVLLPPPRGPGRGGAGHDPADLAHARADEDGEL